MNLRRLQIVLAIVNCLFGVFLLARFGHNILGIQNWPPTPDQIALALIAVALLPLAIFGLTFPSVAGILQFACASFGTHFAELGSSATLLLFARISMGIAVVILAVAIVGGLVGITPELFESPAVTQPEPLLPRKQKLPRRAA